MSQIPLDTVDLSDAEARVRKKWIAALEASGAAWPTPSEPFNASDWMAGEPPPSTLQLPPQRWADYPALRRVALAVCDRMLDFADQLTDEQWAALNFLIQYGGRTPL